MSSTLKRFPTNPRTFDEVGGALRAIELTLRSMLDPAGAIQAQIDDSIDDAIVTLEGGITDIVQFYAANTEGGSPDYLHTVNIEDGRVVSWVISAPAGGVDTASKRGSAIRTLGFFMGPYPIPDGSVDVEDRKQLAGAYSGV